MHTEYYNADIKMFAHLIVAAIVPALILGYQVIPCNLKPFKNYKNNWKIIEISFQQVQTIFPYTRRQLGFRLLDAIRHRATLIGEEVLLMKSIFVLVRMAELL